MEAWLHELRGDPRAWLFEEGEPAVRHLALRWLEDRPPDDAAVIAARAAAMQADPIAAILAAQDEGGWWVKAGAGYGPKYTGTTWSLIFLDQLGADPADSGIQRGCAYLLDHAPTESGGLGMSGLVDRRPPPSSVVHCLNVNLVRALVGFGWLDDRRVAATIEWQAHAITGIDPPRYHRSGTAGPGFACGINEGLPCAWGATKALLGLARVPPDRRSLVVVAALEAGEAFLLSVDPATAAYPAGWTGRISSAWFKPGFPSGYVADIVQVLEVLAELGKARDRRLEHALGWLLSKQDAAGRFRNEYPYRGRLWADVDRPGAPSKWVTLRACRVLRAALG
ncbi:MAG: nitrogen fixation protein NifH [Candidatus Limnocylindrales bacterium]